MFHYQVSRVLRVVDGDTVDLEIDLGFHLKASYRFRILGIDTPEKGELNFLEATEFTKKWLEAHVVAGNKLQVLTQKGDSFGRWLADVFVLSKEGSDGLRQSLIKAGLAVEYRR